ncbi:hypothetical protein MMAG44476_25254 [Mycolicibacterium mageritense DSM 44476 = CIP 104973]|uniref:Uncharacterized protein n=3 Tax=Mycolicibacterium mageritense TaxID=53462 RepID=A0ABN5YH80_MYCME|nr:hypothetical protein MMAGJ_67460 [Mycolicibacterium mageritense]
MSGKFVARLMIDPKGTAQMSICPNGHRNPAHWEFCNECGEPIDDTAQQSEDSGSLRLTPKALVAALVAAVAVALGVLVAVVVGHDGGIRQSEQPTQDGAAIRDWWAESRDDFAALQVALDDTQDALKRQDVDALRVSCQQMHDGASVDLPSHLPTPDPELTNELKAATDDAHQAAHMCLAAVAGSMNSYRAEFDTDLAQAQAHLEQARDIVGAGAGDSRYAAR